jgi:hypothetical protein
VFPKGSYELHHEKIGLMTTHAPGPTGRMWSINEKQKFQHLSPSIPGIWRKGIKYILEPTDQGWIFVEANGQ